jgi:class 3 adenylate cyclase
MGDQAWRRLLDTHDQLAIQTVAKHHGSLIKTTGDGIWQRLMDPGRAVRCAFAFVADTKQLREERTSTVR